VFVITPGYLAARSFAEGLAAVAVRTRLGVRWGYLDRTGTPMIAPRFEEAYPFSEGLAVVKTQGLWGLIDRTGKVVTIFPQAVPAPFGFSGGLLLVTLWRYWGYADHTGRLVIQPRYDAASVFCGGLARVTLPTEGRGALVGYIDHTGRYVWGPAAP